MKKAVILIAAILFLLLAGMWIYVQSEAFSTLIRPYVVGPIGKVLGPGASIGRVKANLLPLYLELRDIRLAGEGSGHMVSIRKVRLYINPFPLLVKKISIPHVMLLEPKLDIERTTSGEFNIVRLVEMLRLRLSEQAAAGAGYRVAMRSLSIHNGGIQFVARPASIYRLTDLYANIRLNPAAESIKLSIRSSNIRLGPGDRSEIYCRLSGSAFYSKGRLDISSLSLIRGGSLISVAGRMGINPFGSLDLKMSGSIGLKDIDVFIKDAARFIPAGMPMIKMTVSVTGDVSRPVVGGTLSLSGVNTKAGELRNAALAFTFRDSRLDISGKNWILVNGSSRLQVDLIRSTIVHRGPGLDLEELHISAGDLNVRLSGRIDTVSGLDVIFTAESMARGRSLSYFTKVPLEGRVSLKGVITGQMSSPVIEGVLSGWPVTVRGTTFDEAGGMVSYSRSRLVFSRMEIRRGSQRYILDADINYSGDEPFYGARLSVYGSDVMSIVSMFYPGPLPVEVSATGEIVFSGTKKDFSAEAKLSLGSGRAYGERFTKGSLTIALTPSRISFPEVTVMKGGGAVNASGWIGFDGTYSADIAARSIDLSELDLLSGLPFSGRFNLDISSSGRFHAPVLMASLRAPEIFASGHSMAGLTMSLNIKNAELSFDARMDRGLVAKGRLSLRKPYSWSVDGSMMIDGFDPFIILGEDDLIGRSRVYADGRFSFAGEGLSTKRLNGNAVFGLFAVSIGDYRIQNDTETGFSLSSGRLLFRDTGFSGPGTKLFVSGFTDLFEQLNFHFRGAADLSLLRVMYREVEHSAGVVDASLSVTSGWDNPEVSGRLSIKGGEVRIKDIPQKFANLSGTVEFDREGIVTHGISGAVGGGAMRLAGYARLAGLSLKDFSVKMAFRDVTVRHPIGLTATMTGELSYDGDPGAQILSGEVEIKRARYDRRVEWKSMLVDMARGIHQKKKAETAWIGNTEMNIRFFGKDNIILHNNLAKIELGVDVFIRGTVNQPQLIGRVEAIKGVVYFRRNDFNIIHAAVDFTEPMRINPFLDIMAETRVREYNIRLSVSGTADRANVTFLSDPPLPDADILSLLAFGKTGSEIKEKEAGVGMGEAASFATGQFQDIFERRARSLTGLDRFQVDPSLSRGDTTVPRVTIGKEVIPDRLFVTYSSNVGGLAPEPVFRIEYILNKNFSLLGERNEIGNIGADVKFRFEFR